VEKIIENLLKRVELLVREQDAFGLKLDGSLASIEQLDAYIDDRRAEGEDGLNRLFCEARYPVLLSFGAYVGEVIIGETSAARWALGIEDPTDLWETHIAGTATDLQVFPLRKALKRFENGPEDSLLSFATIAIGLFAGEFGFEQPLRS
jgi:hypothetical protein